MAWYAIAWHDISVSLSSVSNCLILSCLELCCVVLSCAVPHCILHGSVCCLVLNSAVHCIEFCCALLCSVIIIVVLCCRIFWAVWYRIVFHWSVLYCLALRSAVCCVLFHSSVFSWGKHPGFGITCDCKLSPAWSPRNAPSAVWGLPNMARWRSTWTPRWQRTTRPGTAAGCSKSCCVFLSKFNWTWEHQTTWKASWKLEIIQCRHRKRGTPKKEQQVGSTDIYSWVSLKVGYPKFTNYHHVSPIKMAIWIYPISDKPSETKRPSDHWSPKPGLVHTVDLSGLPCLWISWTGEVGRTTWQLTKRYKKLLWQSMSKFAIEKCPYPIENGDFP